MRFMQRKYVDFPQPDGPMRAVTLFDSNCMLMSFQRLEFPVVEVEVG